MRQFFVFLFLRPTIFRLRPAAAAVVCTVLVFGLEKIAVCLEVFVVDLEKISIRLEKIVNLPEIIVNLLKKTDNLLKVFVVFRGIIAVDCGKTRVVVGIARRFRLMAHCVLGDCAAEHKGFPGHGLASGKSHWHRGTIKA